MFGKWVARLGAAGVAVAVVAALVPASAALADTATNQTERVSATPLDVVGTLTNVGTTWELSANFGDGTTGQVYTVPASDSIYHQWYLSDATGTITNLGTNQCLSSNYGDGKLGDVYTVQCSGVDYQSWFPAPGNVAGSFEIVNAGTGWCLSSNFGNGKSGKVFTVSCATLSKYHDWTD